MRTDRVIRDGKTAVLYSPGFGAGWYTWGHEQWMLFHPRLVAAVEAKDPGSRIAEISDELATEFGVDAPYTGGANQLQIEWVPVGARFEISEYDGAESVRLHDEIDHLIA